MSELVETISVRGRQRTVSAVPVGPNARVLLTGTFLRIGTVHDEFWLETAALPDPESILATLRQARHRPDLFTFAQKLPDVSPRHSYHLEWENLAVARFDSHAEWFEKQINRSVRKHVRKADREGVTAEAVPYTDDLVHGICEIYNELPVRQGRAFWHHGKAFATVKAENGTYLDRSVFIGAYHQNELIGFLKLVFDRDVASIMQILSKASHFERRPTNALIAKAVEVCESRQVKCLTYGEFAYGNKDESTLIDFKLNNGFVRVDVPRYYVPLTFKGRVALRVGLHKGVKEWLPASLSSRVLQIRSKWYQSRLEKPPAEVGKER